MHITYFQKFVIAKHSFCDARFKSVLNKLYISWTFKGIKQAFHMKPWCTG